MDAVLASGVKSIPERLARAWALLSGQARVFEWNADGFVPEISAHTYLLALDVVDTEDKAGIAISLSPSDAQALACAMFRLPLAELSAHDVEDVCLEVCNVLADTLSDLIGPKDRLHTRLPQPLESNGYRQLLMEGALRCSLRSSAQGETSHFIVFNRIHPRFETRPAPL